MLAMWKIRERSRRLAGDPGEIPRESKKSFGDIWETSTKCCCFVLFFGGLLLMSRRDDWEGEEDIALLGNDFVFFTAFLTAFLFNWVSLFIRKFINNQ